MTTKKYFGFSLVELMAVVAVVMVLVSLALPRFRLFIARSRQAEAHANLGIIASLQQTYQLSSGTPSTDEFNVGRGASSGSCGAGSMHEGNALGFRVIDCGKLRYTYTVNSGIFGRALSEGTAGKEIYPNCPGSNDEWTINRQRTLNNSQNIITVCHK